MRQLNWKRVLVITAAVAGWTLSSMPADAATVEFNIAAHYVAPADVCETGQDDLGRDIRCAYEFKVPNLPFGAKVTKATFSTVQFNRTGGERTCSPCPVAFAGYTGDGIGAHSDLSAGETFATIDADGDPADRSFDVTSLVAAIVNNGDQYVGIRMNATDPSVPAGPTAWDQLAINVTYVITAPIHVGFEGAGSGSAVSKPAGLSCPSTCLGNFVVGTTVVVTAKAATGSKLTGWDDYYCRGQDATCTFVVEPAEQWIVPVFAKATPTPTPRPTSISPKSTLVPGPTATLDAASPSSEPSETPPEPSPEPSLSPGTPVATTFPPMESPLTTPPSSSLQPSSSTSQAGPGAGPVLALVLIVIVAAAALAGLRLRSTRRGQRGQSGT